MEHVKFVQTTAVYEVEYSAILAKAPLELDMIMLSGNLGTVFT